MKYLLIYYTGTYNTRFLTEMLKTRLLSDSNVVDTVEINANTPFADVNGYDFIGFSYPIYGFNAPLPFERYVKKLKINKGQRYFIYKNSGETLAMNNASSRILLKIMKKRKAEFCGEYHFIMPYNIHFPFDKDFVKELLQKDLKLIEILVHNLNNGIAPKIKSNFIYNAAAFFVSIQKIGGNVNSFLYKVDKNKCINCSLCINNCPENNIVVKGNKIIFRHSCDMCMRCSFFCPTNAINIGFLEGWKVNGDYNLNKLLQEGSPEKPYITENSKGFYKCFIKSFKKIDEDYKKIFNN